MVYLFLLPPSEGKKSGGISNSSKRTFDFEIPEKIAISASTKDLKCAGKRYDEAIQLNKSISSTPVLPAIERYSGVMYSTIDYSCFSDDAKKRFDSHTMLLSALRGLLCPQDTIPNYKLPITTKLRHYWKDTLTDALIDYAQKQSCTHIIDLLSGTYKKLFDFKKLKKSGLEIIEVTFLQERYGDLKKMTHGVKGVKGRWLREVIEKDKLDKTLWTGEFEEGVMIQVSHYE